jgi:ParB family transcriptional regulator, chromosome partitioning protein
MRDKERDPKVEMIPIDQVNVLNPRVRNKNQHREIIDNIAEIGLKRPITVSRRPTDGRAMYELVCGQGRLEAFQALGEVRIPAIVIEVPESDCLLMSLVENIARCKHRPMDLMREIGNLHKRGYSDAEIAEKIGVTQSWVAMILTLLERGEERLIAAVESGLIPISLAISIARASDAEIQNVLTDAYSSGQLKGRKLTAVRRLLERRAKHSKAAREPTLGRRNPARKVTVADLMRIYQREAEKQRLLVKKSDYTQTKLLFLVEAIKDLIADERFIMILRAERLDTMPRALTARIGGEKIE